MKVYKYALQGKIAEVIEVELSSQNEVLYFGIDEYNNTHSLWALVDEMCYPASVKVCIMPTGDVLPEPMPGYTWAYRNTYKTNNGLMVWHGFVQERFVY